MLKRREGGDFMAYGFGIRVLVMWSLLAAISLSARADDSSSTSSVRAESKAQLNDLTATDNNKVDDQTDVDSVLTNPNLRAFSGSKSKWSISNAINYDGGSLSNPLGAVQPNPSGGSNYSADTDLNDQINVKYNLNSTNAIMLGFGVRKIAPFSSTGPSPEFRAQGGQEWDAYDPVVNYQNINRIGPVQNVLQIGFAKFTRSDFTSPIGQNWNMGWGVNLYSMVDLGKSGFTVGAYTFVGGNTPTNDSYDWSAWQYGMSPKLEYLINRLFTLTTQINLWNYEIYGISGHMQDKVTDNLGVQIKLTRDFIIQPYIVFAPNHIAAINTQCGVLTTLNVF
jgi:hypothetical protein